MYPNPAQEALTIEIKLSYSDHIVVSLQNYLGQELLVNQYQGFEGLNLLTMDALNARPGLYF